MGIFDFPHPLATFPTDFIQHSAGCCCTCVYTENGKFFRVACLLARERDRQPHRHYHRQIYFMLEILSFRYCATTTVELEQSVGSKKQHKTSEFYWQKIFCEHFC